MPDQVGAVSVAAVGQVLRRVRAQLVFWRRPMVGEHAQVELPVHFDDRFDLQRVADDERALRAPHCAKRVRRHRLASLVDQQQADLALAEVAKAARDRGEGARHHGDCEEKGRPQVRRHRWQSRLQVRLLPQHGQREPEIGVERLAGIF